MQYNYAMLVYPMLWDLSAYLFTSKLFVQDLRCVTFMKYKYGIMTVEKGVRMLENCIASYKFPSQVV